MVAAPPVLCLHLAAALTMLVPTDCSFTPKLLVSRDSTVTITKFSQSRDFTPPAVNDCPKAVDGSATPKDIKSGSQQTR